MRHQKLRPGHVGAALACLGLAACDNSSEERTVDRFQQYAEILAGARLAEPADLTGVTGTATFTGMGFGQFPAQAPSSPDAELYNATSDVTLTADFTGGTLSGDMTNWIPENSRLYTMDGRSRLVISEGAIAPDGTFTARVSGNVTRTPTALLIESRGGTAEDAPGGFNFGFVAPVEGTFHDGLDGRSASHVVGTFDGEGATGGFVARR
jgi:hypothetical protein